MPIPLVSVTVFPETVLLSEDSPSHMPAPLAVMLFSWIVMLDDPTSEIA